MVAKTTPICEFGLKAKDFSLPDTNGKYWTLADAKGENGLLVMFICNHCPFVQAILPELIEDTKKLKDAGINTVAIMSNDSTNYPDDSLENMQKLAQEQNFPFPYLFDESQEVAKVYNAVCTPDFFGFNKELELQYRGRFDSSGINRQSERSTPELLNAMLKIAKTGKGAEEQNPSIGCSIKWK